MSQVRGQETADMIRHYASLYAGRQCVTDRGPWWRRIWRGQWHRYEYVNPEARWYVMSITESATDGDR